VGFLQELGEEAGFGFCEEEQVGVEGDALQAGGLQDGGDAWAVLWVVI
jgi:hypothetical protein